VLPEFNVEGDLPGGVHLADWRELQLRFGLASPRRVWLFDRLRTLVELAARTGKLRRVFIWGSFVTSKLALRNIDLLLIMNENFEVDQLDEPAR
jgi:hypothetical protein